MRIYKVVFFFLCSLVIFSCSTEPQAITYGSDLCSFCKMTISDHKFATEIVTNRGRTYKFDCIECMIRYKKKNFSPDQVRMELVSNYFEQKNLLDVDQATFLKSEGLPSPMGEGLSAYGNANDMNRVKQQYGGTPYSWKELNEVVK